MIIKILKWIWNIIFWTVIIGSVIIVAVTSENEDGGCTPNPDEQTETEEYTSFNSIVEDELREELQSAKAYIQYLENKLKKQEEQMVADREDLIRQIEWQYGIKILDEEPSSADKVTSEVVPGFYWDLSVPDENNAQK